MSTAAAPPVEHPMLAGLAAVSAGLAGLVEVNAWSMAGADVEAGLELLVSVEARLAAVKLALVAEADGRRLGRADGAASTAGWLRQRLLTHPRTAARTVELAGALRGPCTATGGALSAGQLSADHAHTIVAAMASLPPVGAGVRARAEEFLIAQASVLDPVLLARAGRALAQTLQSTPDADERTRRAEATRTMSRAVAADGMVCWHGWLDPEADAVLCAALDPLAAPHPANDGTPDPRTPGRRRADALIDLARLALASPAMPDSGGLRPTLNVTIDWQTLSRQLTGRPADTRPGAAAGGAGKAAAGGKPDAGGTAGGGRLHTGEPITPEAARRIGCDAKILPVLLGAAGQPLDIGRATRTITATIRAALNVRDNGCAFPGCDALKAWCDGHHITHWAHGGETTLHNLVLLCGNHHKTVHHHGWTVTIEGDGLPTFHPPPWTDPTRQPRRHHRYHLRQLQFHAGDSDPAGHSLPVRPGGTPSTATAR